MLWLSLLTSFTAMVIPTTPVVIPAALRPSSTIERQPYRRQVECGEVEEEGKEREEEEGKEEE